MTLDMQIKQFDLAERQMESAENARYEVERKNIITNLHKH